MKSKVDTNTSKIKKWISKNPAASRRQIRKFMDERQLSSEGIAHLLHSSERAEARKELVASLKRKK